MVSNPLLRSGTALAAVITLLASLALAHPVGLIGPAEPAAMAAPQPNDEDDGIGYEETDDELEEDRRFRGPRNVVQLVNRKEDRLRVKGDIQLNRMRGDEIAPVNLSYAQGSCTDCETFTVALQLNLYQNGASTVAPQNAAVAINDSCTRCFTVAWALQVSLPLEDPREVPHSVDRLIREMDRELRDIHSDSNRITVEIAKQRIEAVIAEFIDLANEIWVSRDEAISGDSQAQTPTPVASPSPAAGTPTAPATAATVEPTLTSLEITPQATPGTLEPAALPVEPTATATPVPAANSPEPTPVPAPPSPTAEPTPAAVPAPPSQTPPPTATLATAPTATALLPPSPLPAS